MWYIMNTGCLDLNDAFPESFLMRYRDITDHSNRVPRAPLQ
jgi:hypothetical protein